MLILPSNRGAMDELLLKGTVSFVNYEKQFATIDYVNNNKPKTVNCRTDTRSNNNKSHYFRVGDEVNFQLKLSGRGDKMTAHNIKFLYNPALHLLIQRSAVENRFSGYLKKADDRFFVKELDSYLFFPLIISPWEMPPVETANNEAISFSLTNTGKPNQITAELFSHNYIPEYRMALQHFKNQIEAEANIYKISPHAVYVKLFNDKMYAKLRVSGEAKNTLREGDKVQVIITHLTSNRIVIKEAENH